MIWAIFALAATIGACLLICYYTFHICFYSSADRYEDPYRRMRGEQYDAVKESIIACTRRMDDAPCQWVSTTSYDCITLSARYYHTADGAPVQIMFHGYRSMALRDCAGGWALAQKMGFNVLVVDQRAHARSGGRVITFGIRERKDCLSWVQYASERFGKQTPIVLSGLSMGAATVLMASELDLPDNVVAIMADCPYSDPADIIRKVCTDERYPAKLVYPFIRLGAKIYGGLNLEECSAESAVSNAKIPILLVHGEDDRFVPCEMSRVIYEACASPAQLHTYPMAGHGLCYMVDPKRYELMTVEFLYSVPALQSTLNLNPFALNLIKESPLYKKSIEC